VYRDTNVRYSEAAVSFYWRVGVMEMRNGPNRDVPCFLRVACEFRSCLIFHIRAKELHRLGRVIALRYRV
jgi:hypothetical protein